MPKPISDAVIDVLEEGLFEGMKHSLAFLAYEGTDPKFLQKAKVGGVLVGSYVKAIATQTNRMAVEQAMLRQQGEWPPALTAKATKQRTATTSKK